MSRLALVIALVLPAAACTVGDGKGALAGTLFVEECEDVPFTTYSNDGGGQPGAYNMNPSFFVAEPVDDLPRAPLQMNRVSIRVQSAGNRLEEADVMYINIADVRDIAINLAAPITVGPVSNLRASLVLNETCPAHQTQLELDGTLGFTAFGSATTAGNAVTVPGNFSIHYGDTLTAAFSFDVVDRRAIVFGGPPTAGGHLDGNFDFVVRQSPQAQAYP